MVFAFNTARGNIHLEFLTVEEADEVFNNWQPHFLGQNSVIRKASTQEKINKAEVIRHVPTEKTETQIETDLAFNFKVKASRFVKKDGTVLGTVKLIFETSQDQEKVTTDGIFLDNIFYRAQPFVQQGIKMFGVSSAKSLAILVPIANRRHHVGTSLDVILSRNVLTKMKTLNVLIANPIIVQILFNAPSI